MPKVLVLFYSRTGNTAALADAIVEGAKSVRFSEVDVRRIDDLARCSVDLAPRSTGANLIEPALLRLLHHLVRARRPLG